MFPISETNPGSKHDVLLVSEGRSRNFFNEHSLEYRNWPDGGVRRPIDIRMDGMAVFNFVVRNVPPVLTEVLKNAGVPADAVDRLLLHQANLFMIEQVAKQIGISRDKMPVSLDRYGNSSSATLPVTICSELAGELQTERKRTLLCGIRGRAFHRSRFDRNGPLHLSRPARISRGLKGPIYKVKQSRRFYP